jgi:hypothetical protein
VSPAPRPSRRRRATLAGLPAPASPSIPVAAVAATHLDLGGIPTGRD